MGITISTLHSYFTGEFEESTTLDIVNNTQYRLVLRTFNLNRGEVLSNSGEPLDRVPARQGVAKTVLRMRGDRTGEEQPLWLKPREPLALHVTICYALMDKGQDSGLKLVIKMYRPASKEPILHARLTRHHSPEHTINQITDEYTPDSGDTVLHGLQFAWAGGRPSCIRLERVIDSAS